MTSIETAIQEALDAIGDDPCYAAVRRELLGAEATLTDGTTADAHGRLETALRLIDEACPI